MPIEIKDCDDGIGNVIVLYGVVTDQELMDVLKAHLTQGKEKFKKYKYILFDHTGLTKINIADETVKFIAGIGADASKINPELIAALVANVSIGANIDLVSRVSRIHELFVYRSYWKIMVFRTRIEAVRWIKNKAREKYGVDNLTFG